jgi:hypothetical protein
LRSLGPCAQLVAGKIELLELGEASDRLGQRPQFVVGKIEHLERKGILAKGDALRRLWRRLFGDFGGLVGYCW